jgi:hypothetical protein
VKIVVGSLLFFALVNAAFSSEVDDRYKQIFNECLNPSYQNVSCRYEDSTTPLQISKTFSIGVAVLDDDAGTAIDTIKEAVWGASRLLNPDQSQHKAWIAYQNAQDWAKRKAQRENLKDCQKACLATCISSKVMDEGSQLNIQNARSAIETESGVCREFTAVAVDLMKSFGLDASYAAGSDKEWDDNDEVFRSQGAHVIVSVKIDGKNYLMEPQNPECDFYNPNFTGQHKDEKNSYLEGTAPKAAVVCKRH